MDQFESEFKETLHNTHSTVDNWLNWLNISISNYLRQYEGTKLFSKKAKGFFLKWSFLWFDYLNYFLHFSENNLFFLKISTSIIRDLTLRSADSFGSFHMLRLLFDEYINFILEKKVAHQYNFTTLEAMNLKD